MIQDLHDLGSDLRSPPDIIDIHDHGVPAALLYPPLQLLLADPVDFLADQELVLGLEDLLYHDIGKINMEICCGYDQIDSVITEGLGVYGKG